MKVNEIFFSIQGEGINAGKPTIFLRLRGCNLQCNFCDSNYAKEEGDVRTISQVIGDIEKISNGCKHIVITGGEPLLQQDELLKLTKALNIYSFEFETNGTQKVNIDLFNSLLFNMTGYSPIFNVSFKLNNSGMRRRLKKDSIDFWKKLAFTGNRVFFKFVISDKKSLKETLNFIKQYDIPKENVFFMPEGIDSRTIITRMKWLANELRKYPKIRISPRLHVIMWENKRGV